ncbi:MAG: GNAT family N-acetyltransferase, partial [Planktomarina sp.]
GGMSVSVQEMAAIHRATFSNDRAWGETEFSQLCADPMVQRCGDAKSFLMTRKVLDEVEVLTLATHPKFQRQGLARIVLQTFITDCANDKVASIFLEVAVDNFAAISLYHSFGFAEVGVRKAYYQRADDSKVDARVLRLEL